MDSYAKKKKPNYFDYKAKQGHKSRHSSNLEAGLKGFLCTCNFREKECIRESYNLLNEYADRFCGVEDADKKVGGDAAGSEAGEGKEEEEEEEEEDIQSSLSKELNSLKAEHKKSPELRRFQMLDSGSKNCIFIRTTLLDPVGLVHHIVKEVEETKKQKTRFLLRLLPIEITCKAFIDDIVQSANPILEKYFAAGEKTFSVIFTCRNNKSVSRDKVIDELAKLVTEKNATNRVDLKQPELAIIIEIIRNICCIGVLPDYYRYRRYNLLEIAGIDQTQLGTECTSGDQPGRECKDGGEKSEPLSTADKAVELEEST